MFRLRLYFLGTPRIELDGEPVSLSHHKALALLAYLAVTHQRHTRAALAALLWPNYESAGARSEIRRMLWVINKSLGQGWLEVDREIVQLPPQPNLWLDVKRFRELLASGHRSGHVAGEVCPACLEPLTEAVSLAQGDFLAGFTLSDSPEFDTWQRFETESLRRELAGGLERLVQLLILRGEPSFEEAIIYARRWLALDPLHEPAQRQLMQLYAWTGQPTAAFQQYQSCVRLLEQELSISPSTETTALIEAIKANRLPPPAVFELPPQPVVASISPPSLPAHNLPVQATPFIGRETTLESLQQRLTDPEVRLITIIGPGGIGKTRLALALAEKQLQPGTDFSNGIYFISLAPVGSARTMAETIAEGLTIPLTSAEEPAVQLLAYLRHRRLLLVLDNFEHLLAGAGLVSQILQTAAGVKIIVTSRERLNLANETIWPIGGLNFSKLTSVETAMADEAVRLFIQRARRMRPDFMLRPEDLPHLERILQQVWGMPLAIELAAGWLHMLAVAEVATELGRGLDLLEGELRDVPDRHRSMRLVFDRSWERLDAEEQSLFKALSVFQGGFTREAARQVTGASLRLLAGLVNKSLLTSQPDRERYELHELLRQYAAMRLQESAHQERAVRDRHSRYYLTLLQSLEPALRSSRQKETLAALNTDIANIRFAWDAAVTYEEIDRLHRTAFPLWYFYNVRDSLREGESAFSSAAGMVQARLAAIGPGQSTPDRARLEGALGELLSHQAQFTFRQGRSAEAAALYQSSLALLRPLDEPAALGQALTYCGVVCWIAGEFDRAWPYLNEGLSVFSKIGDEWLQAQGRTFMGMVAHAQGDYAGAYDYLSDSMSRARALGDPRLMALIVGQLGRAAQALGRTSEVLDLLRESLRLTTETDDRLGIGVTLEQMAVATQASGDPMEARRLLEKSIDQFRDVGDTWFLAHALNLAGYFALAASDEAQAYENFRQAGQVALAAQSPPNLLDALAGLAQLYARQEQHGRALELAAHILQHQASSHEAKDRAEQVRAAVEAQLPAPQIKAEGRSFETVVKETLGAALWQ